MRLRFSACLLLLTLVGPAAVRAAEAPCPAAISGSGSATWYSPPDDASVACGLPAVTPGEYTVAVTPSRWAGSGICGRCLEVTGPLGTIVARVRDECPGCTSGDLDMSQAAFAAIGNPLLGIVPITWRSTPCPFSTPVKISIDPGSNPYYVAFNVLEHRFGIDSVQVKENGGPGYFTAPRTTYDSFVATTGTALAFPLALRLFDVHGQAIDETMTSADLASGGVYAGTHQFPNPVCLTASAPPPAASAMPAAAAPNPFASATQLRFTLALDQPVRVEVFDAGGRRVRSLANGAMTAGPHALAWDGRDGADLVVPAGLYLVRIMGRYESHVLTVARMR